MTVPGVVVGSVDPAAIAVSLAAMALVGLVCVPQQARFRAIAATVIAVVIGSIGVAAQATTSGQVPGLECEPWWVFVWWLFCW